MPSIIYFVSNITVADRLEKFRLSLGLTWRQTAERLKLSVPMLMQVRSGLRNMGPLALRRLEEAEQSAQAEIRARKVVDGLLNDQGSTRKLIEKMSAEGGQIRIPLRYLRVSGAESLPASVVLINPSSTARENILAIFRTTMDPIIIILACVGGQSFDEELLAKITPACLQNLQQAAMTLFFGPRWRTTVVKMALADAE